METISFPDHHNYTEQDIRLIMFNFEKLNSRKKIIITTEKDSIRFNDFVGLNRDFRDVLYYLPVRVKFLDEEGKMFNKKIESYVGENKSNRELHKRKNNRES